MHAARTDGARIVPLLFAIVLLCLVGARAEQFAGEPWLEGASVVDNGTSSAIPSRLHTATQFQDFPADFGDGKTYRLEMATLPVFGDMGQSWNGAMAYTLDGRTQLSVAGKVETIGDIQSRPLLNGSREDRLNDPGFRPVACDGCTMYTDNVYMTSLNLIRVFRTEFPRIDISSREIPIEFGLGVTAKYYLEELVQPDVTSGDFLLQNMNMDLGASMKFLWGWDPISKVSDRDIKVQFSGLELLPTRQQTTIDDQVGYEDMTYRWRISADWEEAFPDWQSIFIVGFTQKSEGSSIPAFGAEWDFKEMLFLRGGFDDDFISAGASMAWRWISFHYAFRHHALGNSLYQVSGQVTWP